MEDLPKRLRNKDGMSWQDDLRLIIGRNPSGVSIYIGEKALAAASRLLDWLDWLEEETTLGVREDRCPRMPPCKSPAHET